MRILFFGDVVGELGRLALKKALPNLQHKYSPDFIIANGENISHGKGITENHYNFLINLGVDCVTLGNHYHDKVSIDDYIDEVNNIVRPLNLKKYNHGVGSLCFDINGINVRITNILGQAFLNEDVYSPFESMEKLLLEEEEPCIHIVDYHGESTSEKQTFAFYFDGSISAVIGTHTHVQTNDMRVLPNGSAFISDVGMVGELNSVIGFKKESVIDKIVYGKRQPFILSTHGTAIVNGVIMDFDDLTYKCLSISPISLVEENL